MNGQKLFILAETVRWTQAKSRQYPHEYIVKSELMDDALYEEFFHHIRNTGERYRALGRVYVCLKLRGHYYWTMTRDVTQSRIINRTTPEHFKGVKI